MAAKTLEEVTRKTYAEQAIFFLNAFWKEHGTEAEQVWTWWQKFVELDKVKGKQS
jgi:hypothetical protein